MKTRFWQLCVLALSLLATSPLRGAAPDTREQLGTFRFALRDLPPILAPAPPFFAYMKNGRNENPYEDYLPRGSMVGIIEPMGTTVPRERSAPMTTYSLVLVTSRGEYVHRFYMVEGPIFRVRLLFPGSDLFGPGPKPTEKALRQAFGSHIVFEGK